MSHNQKTKEMKEGDLILVSAEATGLGKPMEAVIDKIETFMGQTLVTVTYTQPDALSGFGGCFVDSHITLSEKKPSNLNIFQEYSVYLQHIQLKRSIKPAYQAYYKHIYINRLRYDR